LKRETHHPPAIRHAEQHAATGALDDIARGVVMKLSPAAARS